MVSWNDGVSQERVWAGTKYTGKEQAEEISPNSWSHSRVHHICSLLVFFSQGYTHMDSACSHFIFLMPKQNTWVDEFKYISRLKLHSIHFCFWLQIKAFDKPFNPHDRRRTWDDGQPFLTWTLEFKQKLKITCLIT